MVLVGNTAAIQTVVRVVCIARWAASQDLVVEEVYPRAEIHFRAPSNRMAVYAVLATRGGIMATRQDLPALGHQSKFIRGRVGDRNFAAKWTYGRKSSTICHRDQARDNKT